MFTKSITTLVALVTSLFVLTGLASAQYLPDFTSMDVNGMFNSWNTQLNTQIDQSQQQLIAQVLQDPNFQSMYQQYLASGGTATPEQYAYQYAATGGFSAQGMQNYQNSEAASAAKIQGAWQDYQNSVQGYQDAYGNYTGGFANNQTEFGNTLMGNSTYVNPGTGSSYVLPHTWQTDSYNTYNGQNYYVDQAGQYFWIDPNNTGWMYPIYQGQ
jgi:hypothetical protein